MDERIAALESRLALVEARLAAVEARPHTYYWEPARPITPAPYNLVQCSRCGTWLAHGATHFCTWNTSTTA